ncbi:type ISP restriction/modification enzyme [Bradyrhizobium sp. SZCCHNS2015]|uniref:type ISP restriction/modification enzyme n=1 Tax=Bradyrhizobium sp. SZCCHNS2015 TaxID=3057305 RepID=UPI0028E7D883|nr:type ISP restriction/modification enzyme [Bradyrhizobium sp. SZCCHNS2015]
MPTDHRTELASIKRFDQLIRYLRDPMGWPIHGEDFEELTFEYTPEELGIDSKNAAKIQEIKRLRPLSPSQPWGIFFVKFEPKNLPVVALRRVLSSVALKKRASANAAERAAWAADDLLFVSNYGKGDERQISFAHFSRAEDGRDLPTLKVLGWDSLDTALHLDAVAKELIEHLAWPKDDRDVEAWRTNWRAAFNVRHREVVTTSKELSIRLAELARSIRDRIKTALAIETERGPLTKLLKGFREALVHDLDSDGFADMYAQTIAYGLLSARIADPHKKTADDFAAHMRTNPFLRELMETFLHVGGRRGRAGGPGIDFDELGVSEVVELLDAANMEAVVRDFGDRNRNEDPVIHFYELFLHEYDKELKIQRGVFYTPQPVVSYIVRSIHELLQTEFGLADGLADTSTWGDVLKRHPGLKLPPLMERLDESQAISADEPFVQILDPATGTATFLVEVIDIIHRTLSAKWKQQRLTEAQQRAAWNDYVPRHLLPRVHAFELMMAPYAIAHMKIGLKLAETGYQFGTEERARIYLTNALEKADQKQTRLIGLDALAHEAEAVNKIKSMKRFTVIVGNPPYANYSANLSPDARRIVDKYRSFHGAPIRERNQLQFERNIQDDFVKFVSIAQDMIGASGLGIIGYITNGTMLASSSLRGMREALARQFDRLFELNLHGGRNEIISGSEHDENVFDIVQSVAIHIYARSKSGGAHEVSYADFLGRRSSKYGDLASQSVSNTEWRQLKPDTENCSFTPQDEAVGKASRRLDSAFVRFGAGIKTNRDDVAINFDDASLLEEVRKFDRKVASSKRVQDCIYPILYRPFDVRRIFYHEDIVASRSFPTMKHIIAGPNIGLVCSSTWTTPERFSVGVSRSMVEMKTGTHDRGTTFFPLYRYESLLGGKVEKLHNLTPDFVAEWCDATGTRFVHIGRGDGQRTTGPEDILNWLFALFYSTEYRRRYRAALSRGFPLVLFTSDLELFRALRRLGGELVSLHLLESPKLSQFTAAYSGPKNPEVGRVGWSDDTVWLDATVAKKDQSTHGTISFRGVSEDVWKFRIAGYQVCEKWLKDRKGLSLSKDDVVHYQKIVAALSETIRIIQEIDEVIAAHGGFATAFDVEAPTAIAPRKTK